MASTMYAEFAMYGDELNPEDITGLLGLQPDVTWRKGDPKGRPGGPARRREGCWMIVTERSVNQDASLDDHLQALLRRISPVTSVIANLSKKFDSEFTCVVHYDDEVPVLHIEPEVFKAMSALNAAFDMDGYLWAEAEQTGK